MKDGTPLVERAIKRAYNLGLKAVPNFLQLSLEQIAYYEKHLDEIPDALLRGFIVPTVSEKFSLLVDLGTIIVPDDYVHETQLASFREENHKRFIYYNDNITDKNFPNPSRILKPGDRLRVRIFKQSVSGITTTKERMEFMEKLGAVYTGVQGVSLVFDQKRDLLPRDFWCVSYDHAGHLWKDADGNRRVPGVRAGTDGVFEFCLGDFAGAWSSDYCVAVFCDE